MDFFAVLNFKNLAMAEQQSKRTPICFFLFSLECHEQNVPLIVRELRNSRVRQIKFAPLVGFTETANPKIVEFCLQLGFDDILLPPFSRKNVNSRLAKHLDRNISFFETTNYFGPDRRAALNANTASFSKSRRQSSDHRKIVISRNLETGINILRDQFHSQTSPTAPARDNSISI